MSFEQTLLLVAVGILSGISLLSFFAKDFLWPFENFARKILGYPPEKQVKDKNYARQCNLLGVLMLFYLILIVFVYLVSVSS